MAVTPHAPDRAGRRRSRPGLVLHALAVVIFALLAWQGVDAIRTGLSAFGVPMLIAGAAGLGGASAIILGARWRRAGVRRAARIGMVLAATATVVTGVVLAPHGLDRGFVITVNTVVGGLLALFALFA
jgi:hypothetical protein